MSRFSTLPSLAPPPRAGVPYSLGATATPARTGQGGAGFVPDEAKVELFNAAVSGLLADGFYESGDDKVQRIQALAENVARTDPEWAAHFAHWLRASANLRSAPLVVAAAYIASGQPKGRDVVDSVLLRADEPGELLAYWRATYGRKVPSRLKRGVSDACQRLYTQRATVRWDGQSKGYRFGDVLEVCHCVPRDAQQSTLYKYLLDRRRHPAEPIPEELAGLFSLTNWLKTEPGMRVKDWVPSLLSWETLAANTPGGITAHGWETLVTNGNLSGLGLLRNLNNIDKAGVKDPMVIAKVKELLSDPEAVKQARLLPYRFMTAYFASETDRWREALEQGAQAALANLPSFPGTTVIMVDCSGSMANAVGSGKSRQPLSLSQLAGFVAESVARRCEQAGIFSYNTGILSAHEAQPHVGVLRAASRAEYRPQGGTSTWRCTEATVAAIERGGTKVDRVLVLTDEQTSDYDSGAVKCPVVTWNLSGDRAHQARHGVHNRFLVSGYSDTALQTLPDVIVRGSTGAWPWEA